MPAMPQPTALAPAAPVGAASSSDAAGPEAASPFLVLAPLGAAGAGAGRRREVTATAGHECGGGRR